VLVRARRSGGSGYPDHWHNRRSGKYYFAYLTHLGLPDRLVFQSVVRYQHSGEMLREIRDSASKITSILNFSLLLIAIYNRHNSRTNAPVATRIVFVNHHIPTVI
jgi:hypothetical protein